jgi:hypothetical protein
MQKLKNNLNGDEVEKRLFTSCFVEDFKHVMFYNMENASIL